MKKSREDFKPEANPVARRTGDGWPWLTSHKAISRLGIVGLQGRAESRQLTFELDRGPRGPTIGSPGRSRPRARRRRRPRESRRDMPRPRAGASPGRSSPPARRPRACGRWLVRASRAVVLIRVELEDPAAQPGPELFSPLKSIGRRERRRGQDAGPPLEEVGAAIRGALPLRSGDRVGADEAGPTARVALDPLDDPGLRAPGIGHKDRTRPGSGGRQDVLDDPRDRRADDGDLGRSATPSAGSVVNSSIAPRRFASSSRSRSRPIPITRDAPLFERKASPIEPPIRPTPMMDMVPGRFKYHGLHESSIEGSNLTGCRPACRGGTGPPALGPAALHGRNQQRDQ